jgi:HK97 family phage prohead protease
MYTVKANIEREGKKMIAIASTAVEDRHGEKVLVEGWETKNFMANPVLLWAHDHSIPAIGNAKNVRTEGKGADAKMVFEPEFHDITPEARAIKAMFDQGIINSFSVGFKPLEAEGNTFTKQELLEISAVNVPANPEARMMAYKSLETAGFEKSVIKSVIGVIDAEEEMKHNDIEQLTKRLVELEHEVNSLRAKSSSDDGNPYVRANGLKAIDKIAGQLLAETEDSRQRTLLKALDRVTEKLLQDNKKGL